MDIPERVKKIWGSWDIRVFVLLSLFSQTLLVLFSPLRKSKSQKPVTWFIWVVYLVADWVAIFGLGLLSSSRDDSSVDSNGREDDLLALWAPFLLLHLGGPDSITAFSVEDNELWLRQLFGLVSQLLPAGYVLLRSLPGNKLLGSTTLIFIAGIVKYCERTWALYQASSDVFSNNLARKSEFVTDYDNLMEEYMAMQRTKSSRDFEDSDLCDDLTRIQLTQYAYEFFHSFKGLFVNSPINLSQVMGIRSFILGWSAEDVFTIIGVELNFMYDLLYTKAAVLHSVVGYVLRLLSVCAIITAFFLFLSWEKNAYSHFDMAVTYTIFIGALSLEMIGLFNLIVSDRGIIALKGFSTTVSFIAKAHSYRGRRWSESIPQLNIFTVALTGRQKWIDIIVDCLCLKRVIDKMRITSRVAIDDDVKWFIFENLKEKSREKFSQHDHQRGLQLNSVIRWEKLLGKFLPSHNIDNLAESILEWHLITEICYNLAGRSITDNVCFADMDHPDSAAERRISKILSDYMLYLLVMQPTIMTSSGIWRIRYQDICNELKRIPPMESLIDPPVNLSDTTSYGDRRPLSNLTSEDLELICAYLFRTGPKRKEVEQMLDNSLLNEAVIFIKGLTDTGAMTWTTISNKWMKILCQTASRSRAHAHAQRLSEGGELLTFVWLLIAHLGLSDRVE